MIYRAVMLLMLTGTMFLMLVMMITMVMLATLDEKIAGSPLPVAELKL